MLIKLEVQIEENDPRFVLVSKALLGIDVTRFAIDRKEWAGVAAAAAATVPYTKPELPGGSIATATAPADVVVFTEEDVAAATMSLAAKKGVPAATTVLLRYNVERGRDLKPEQRAAYIAEAKAAEVAA